MAYANFNSGVHSAKLYSLNTFENFLKFLKKFEQKFKYFSKIFEK